MIPFYIYELASINKEYSVIKSLFPHYSSGDSSDDEEQEEGGEDEMVEMEEGGEDEMIEQKEDKKAQMRAAIANMKQYFEENPTFNNSKFCDAEIKDNWFKRNKAINIKYLFEQAKSTHQKTPVTDKLISRIECLFETHQLLTVLDTGSLDRKEITEKEYEKRVIDFANTIRQTGGL
jgi:hypothetical protein